MWGTIIGTVFGVTIAAGIYLIFAVARFSLLKKLAGDKKWLKLLISAGCIGAVFGVLKIFFSMINVVIIFLHVTLFFLLFGLGMKLFRKLSGKNPKIYWQGWLAIVTSAVYLSVGYYLCVNVWQTDYNLKTSKPIDTLKVALIADSHVGAIFDGDGFAQRLEQIQEQSPDVLLIAGDFVDDSTGRENMIKACEALGKLDLKYGVWFSYGNHDEGYYGSERRGFSSKDLEENLKQNGVHILKDDYQLVDNRFYIVGRKDKKDKNRADIADIIDKLDTDKYIIVMDHQPGDYENESNTAADLVVSGHTHGGQLIPLRPISTLFGFNDMTYGYDRRNDTDFIVTSGIGCWEIKFKTGTKSEFVIINIEQE